MCYIALQQDAVTEKSMAMPTYGAMAAPPATNGVGGTTTGKKKKKVNTCTTY